MSSNGVEVESLRETTRDVEQGMNGKMNEEHDEYQYLRLIEKVIKTGTKRSNRTDVDTYSIFGAQMRFSLRDGKIIIVSSRIYC